MTSIKYSLLCCAVLSVAGVVQLRAQDRKGCKDSPLITRFPGSTIGDCKDMDFDQADLPLAANKVKHVEGEFHFLSYTPKQGVVTDIQLFRNIETALKAAGFILDYENSPYRITAHHGTTWFHLLVHDTGGNAPTVFIYEETFVTEKQMTQEVTANAATLSSELTASGHTIVPGIYFDTGKADVKPESDASLKEVAKVLQQNPALKLYVVGHTDNVGTLTSNVSLSNQRAASVLKVLTTQYNVAASRLQAYGDGPYAPVASNDSDDGRARNRRVELVKQ
jgi:outer membrane protein OmpA-like peptidoglycan-associated protein